MVSSPLTREPVYVVSRVAHGCALPCEQVFSGKKTFSLCRYGILLKQIEALQVLEFEYKAFRLPLLLLQSHKTNTRRSLQGMQCHGSSLLDIDGWEHKTQSVNSDFTSESQRWVTSPYRPNNVEKYHTGFVQCEG